MEGAVILARGRTVTTRGLSPGIRQSVSAAPCSALNLKAHEARLIREALSRFQGNRRAAEALGISTVSLGQKVKEYGIARDASD